MTEFAPDWRISATFSCSRTAATIQTSGLSWRTVSVASTLESSRSVVMITWLASSTPARRSTSWRVASPVTTARPSACASWSAVGAGVDDDDRLAVLAVVDAGCRRRPGPWCRSR